MTWTWGKYGDTMDDIVNRIIEIVRQNVDKDHKKSKILNSSQY